jgi:CDP-glucose 4,6-dehydratase
VSNFKFHGLKDYSSIVNKAFIDRLKHTKGPVLITGHTGFKGTWLSFLLNFLGVPVIGFSLPPEEDSLYLRANRHGKITEEFSDIRSYSSLRNFIDLHKPPVIVHMAAQPLVLRSYESPRETFEVNVMGTANILDIAEKSKFVQIVIVVTSDKVYKSDNLRSKFKECDSLFGKDPYSASKVGTEAAVAAWQQISEKNNGPKIVSVRAGNVIGGGDLARDRLLPDIIRSHLTGTPLLVRNKNHTRPWQHVLDPLVGYLKVIESILAGHKIKSINFGPNEESLSVSKVIDISSKLIDFQFEYSTEKNKAFIFESQTLNLDTTYANQFLGWNPKFSQIAAIVQSIDWWKKVLNNRVSPENACEEDIAQYFNKI